MYSIDINFLKDRQETKNQTFTQTKAPAPTVQEQLPMLFGLGVMVLLIAFPLGLLFLVKWQTAQTQENVAKLNEQVAQLNAQNQRLGEIQNHIKAIDDNTQSLVTVFNQVKPASAILQEIRNLIPPSIQVTSITQTEIAPQPAPQPAPEGQPAPSTRPQSQISIDGYALNYDDVNKFLLTLQNSSLLKADATKIVKAELAPLPITVENTELLSKNNLVVEFPKGVKYSIVTQLNELPASRLLPALARNGAVGLVTRIQTLEQKGVLKP